MEKVLEISRVEPVTYCSSNIVYGKRVVYDNSLHIQLKLSLIRPRNYYPYDRKTVLPVLVWLCGGAFTIMDRNAWIPELSWYAKRGFAVASVDYSARAQSRFPDNIVDIKQAIRFLRAHAEEFDLDTDRIVLMGESAGGYLAALGATTGDNKDFERGNYLEYSSVIQAAVSFYPVADLGTLLNGGKPLAEGSPYPAVPPEMVFPIDSFLYPDVAKFSTRNTSPILLLHGDADTMVNISHSRHIYDALIKAGARAELYIFKGAGHADYMFVQPEVKQLILDFMKRSLGIT
jgi:acetyl esterase/lipase